MAKSVSKAVFLIVAALLVVSGCGPRRVAGNLAVGPEQDALAIPSGFVAAAIDACGGTDAWIAAMQFDLDCVATFYQKDGSYYLTEQSYTVYPWSNAIRLAGREPDGEFLWQLCAREFSVIQGDDEIERITQHVGASTLAEAVLTATVVPALLLDGRVEFTQMAAPLKLDGRWYSVITRALRPDVQDVQDMADVVFYQNTDTSLVDRILVVSGQNTLLVKAYGYREIRAGGVCVPSRLEVFEASDRGMPMRRLIKIDVK